jgi:hypothetical protein
MILSGLPIFAFIFLKKNREDMKQQQMQTKYATLITNLRLGLFSTHLAVPMFCFKRILLSITTVLSTERFIAHPYIYTFTAILNFGFVATYKPMETKFLNRIELLNEALMVLCSGFLFLFTDFILDLELRFKIGQVYCYLVLFIIALNVALIVWEIGF